MFGNFKEAGKNLALNALLDTLKKKATEIDPKALAELFLGAFREDLEQLRKQDIDKDGAPGHGSNDLADCEHDLQAAAEALGRVALRVAAAHRSAHGE